MLARAVGSALRAVPHWAPYWNGTEAVPYSARIGNDRHALGEAIQYGWGWTCAAYSGFTRTGGGFIGMGSPPRARYSS